MEMVWASCSNAKNYVEIVQIPRVSVPGINFAGTFPTRFLGVAQNMFHCTTITKGKLNTKLGKESFSRWLGRERGPFQRSVTGNLKYCVSITISTRR